ncbi:hypothetical protein CO181_01080 [candidate division WWE3 bacterium CG_4_9_14_3_um_filter_43_9]|uniref:Uncharacterized protein n=1 Tax=candidate division WWE3 bacterium CG_4_9_14_3_um_filter_43_9 TaxID=1975082 RepID=A0A2M7WYD2_UNCKA|nr:MAG: hypothetical protein CO181_01080 [candidate division WWE3 bacterium CG_4_9_14_3_um_filter_43_9]
MKTVQNNTSPTLADPAKQQALKSESNKISMAGFLVDNDRDKIAERKPERLEEFDAKVGRKKFSAITFYPIEITLKYQREAAKILYGNDSLESFYKLGVWDYHIVMDTQLGKILKALYFKDVKSTAMALPSIVNAVSRGIKVQVVDKGEREVEMIYENDPYPQTYFQGMFEEALRNSFHIKGTVTVNNYPDGKRVFNLKW